MVKFIWFHDFAETIKICKSCKTLHESFFFFLLKELVKSKPNVHQYITCKGVPQVDFSLPTLNNVVHSISCVVNK